MATPTQRVIILEKALVRQNELNATLKSSLRDTEKRNKRLEKRLDTIGTFLISVQQKQIMASYEEKLRSTPRAERGPIQNQMRSEIAELNEALV